MKFRTIVIAFFFALLLTPSLKAAGGLYNDAISIEPINLLFMDVVATYETKFSEKNSLAFSLNYFSWGGAGYFGYSGFTDTYVGLSASYRFYLFDWYFFDKNKKHGPIEGFSFGPAVGVGYSTYGLDWDPNTLNWNSKKTLAFSIGGEAAYKWVFAPNWFLEAVTKLWFTFPTGAHFNNFDGGVKIGYTW